MGKTCTKCQASKPLEQFNKHKQKKDGYNSQCKTCSRAKVLELTHKARAEQRSQTQIKRDTHDLLLIEGLKECTKCKTIQVVEKFYSTTGNKDKLRSNCITCMTVYAFSPQGLQASRTKNHRRRVQQSETAVEKVDYLVVFNRDNWICQICKAEVDFWLYHPNPYSASLDHIVPLSRGGAHSYDNVQLTHLRCNMQKSAKIESGV